jgi:hypothetical protein
VAGDQACQNLQKERYAMKEATSIVQFRQPGSVEDPLTEIAREGARRMLATALEAEVEARCRMIQRTCTECESEPRFRAD